MLEDLIKLIGYKVHKTSAVVTAALVVYNLLFYLTPPHGKAFPSCDLRDSFVEFCKKRV